MTPETDTNLRTFLKAATVLVQTITKVVEKLDKVVADKMREDGIK